MHLLTLKSGLIPGIYHLTNWSDFIWGAVSSSKHVCMRASSRHHALIGRHQKRGMHSEDEEREIPRLMKSNLKKWDCLAEKREDSCGMIFWKISEEILMG